MGPEVATKSDLKQPVAEDEANCLYQQAKRRPLPTDSMVTVRLSETSVPPTADALSIIGPEPSHCNPLLGFEETDYSAHGNIPESYTQNKEVAFNTETIPSPNVERESLASSINIIEEQQTEIRISSPRSQSRSRGSFSSMGSAHVDWDQLDKSEEQAPRDEGSDESTAFLLARLEQENNALATDPKAAIARISRNRSKSRPPSIQQLKKMVNEPSKPSLRYSMIPSPPPMTELEFWAALVVDYPLTAQRLPTLTSKKIKSGVPPPLRGVVWISIAGARDKSLEDEYDRLCGESSPYENLIGKDIGRSFPSVEMFRDPSGEGQQMLGKVLKCFSLYDDKIGYCQGLGFVVGPLLMHMEDKEAFCVLVRLMEHYDLRSCFLPDLSGLHLRIYQFQRLLSQHLPTLTAHLESLQVEPLYVSQWFLSFFGVTCPLPMLLRIYDVILTEGASETLMRVALSLMRRNESKILGCTEFEDVMQLLLSRSLWDTYACNADDLVNDFVGLTGLVTRESLENLEISFKDAQWEDSTVKMSSVPHVQAAASRFLGRFWAGSNASNKAPSTSTSLGLSAPSRPASYIRRTPSKQSMASTLNSVESIESHLSTASTNSTALSSNTSAEHNTAKPSNLGSNVTVPTVGDSSKDKDLHRQIEDLLTALSDMQRDQTILAGELQKEREEREEDRALIRDFMEQVTPQSSSELALEDSDRQHQSLAKEALAIFKVPQNSMFVLKGHFGTANSRRSSIVQSKHQLREGLNLWKGQYEVEASKALDLSRQLADIGVENTRLLEQFRIARTRMQEACQDKQRLERQVQELKSRQSSGSDGYTDDSPVSPDTPEIRSGGLREFKLGRTGSFRSQTTTPVFAKRASSLGIQAVLATEDHKPPAEEALLLELVGAKTAEAVARQELEEVKGKLDSLRRLLGNPSPTSPSVGSGHRASPSEPCALKIPNHSVPNTHRPTPVKDPRGDNLKVVTPSPSTSAGGFFSGWGKRTVSTPPMLNVEVPER